MILIGMDDRQYCQKGFQRGIDQDKDDDWDNVSDFRIGQERIYNENKSDEIRSVKKNKHQIQFMKYPRKQ